MTSRKDEHSLLRALAIANELPPLSPLVRHFLEALSSPGDGASLGEIANWIEQDPLMTGRVLALANSALYARSVPILSVRLAVTRLGLNPLRQLVLSVSMSRFWSQLPTPNQWSTARFAHHSVATAVLSEMISFQVAHEEMQLAFLAGLFHDIGRLIIAVLLRQDSEALVRLTQNEHLGLEQAERELVGFPHSEISASIVRSWNLPAPIETAVRFHENPEDEPARWEGDRILLSDIVHAADCYVDWRGISISGRMRAEEDKESALSGLAIGPGPRSIFDRFQDEVGTLLGVL